MKISTKYFLFIGIVHLIPLVLSFFIFQDNKLIFILSEVFLLISLYFAYSLYQDFIQPLKMLMTGVEAIKDQDFNVKFLESGKYEMDQLIGVYNKMIDKLREERTLQQQQHFFLDKLVHTSPTGIIILDYDGKVNSLNPKAKTILGLSSNHTLKGTALRDISHPLISQILKLEVDEASVIKTNGIETFKCHKAQFIDRGFPQQFVMIEEMTKEILLTEKRAYGKAIRMMAHEVNNSTGPINAILNTAIGYFNQLKKQDQALLKENLEVAITRNERLTEFMRNFAEVVKIPLPSKEWYGINHLVQQITTLLHSKIQEKGIDLKLFLDESAPIGFFDVNQLEQVLLNVVKNSIEACDNGGTIIVETRSRPKSIVIKDNGMGINSDQEAMLFTPFFSSKEQGQGIGLTLSREILLNHGFVFYLRTEKDGWTTFRIKM